MKKHNQEYTVDLHYKRIKSMVQDAKMRVEKTGRAFEDVFCDGCPLWFDNDGYPNVWDNPNFDNDECVVCRKFIRLRKIKYITVSVGRTDSIKEYPIRCPCLVLGRKEAVKRTLKAIERYERQHPIT